MHIRVVDAVLLIFDYTAHTVYLTDNLLGTPVSRIQSPGPARDWLGREI